MTPLIQTETSSYLEKTMLKNGREMIVAVDDDIVAKHGAFLYPLLDGRIAYFGPICCDLTQLDLEKTILYIKYGADVWYKVVEAKNLGDVIWAILEK